MARLNREKPGVIVRLPEGSQTECSVCERPALMAVEVHSKQPSLPVSFFFLCWVHAKLLAGDLYRQRYEIEKNREAHKELDNND